MRNNPGLETTPRAHGPGSNVGTLTRRSNGAVSCSTGQVCTASNLCCTPQSDTALCSAYGKTCGTNTLTDNCGTARSVSCGGCSSPNTCSGGLCICTPIAMATACSGKCGTDQKCVLDTGAGVLFGKLMR